MGAQHRGKQQDNRTTEALVKRQQLRKQIELREEAKAAGLSVKEYLELTR
ncbi:hypothetical protein VPKG_00002 [Vibrio phage pYD21-A]|nr:hypothetical protein VPKG_00002 [Vibrio phage pYD21-A]AGH16039.1 hypothetical protein VPKG_00002 [Vibrio phage pYD21-A]